MKYSMFIGRYQPFHKGHKALMETVLKDGGNVLIALRDTEVDGSNPYTPQERIDKVSADMREWGHRVKVIVIPDITEVCYGRGVGYGVRQISMPDHIEEISATKIRNAK